MIPFLVFKKALENNMKNKTELNTQVLYQVTDTCASMIATNNQLKTQTLD